MRMNSSGLIKKLFVWSLIVVLGVLAVFSVLIVHYQEHLIFPYYHQTQSEPLAERSEPLIPEVSRVMIGTADHQIEAWVQMPVEAPKGIALVFRANMGFLADHSSLIGWAADHQLVGIIFNYPGMGLSDGSPSEESIGKASEQVYDYFRQKFLQNGGKTWIIGYSVGTGPAGIFAAKHPPDLLVLFAPYTDIRDVVGSRPFFHFFSTLSRFGFPLKEPIASLRTTDFIVATGGGDTTIAPEMSKKVFDFYHGSGRKFAVQNPTGTHDRLLGANRPALEAAVKELGY